MQSVNKNSYLKIMVSFELPGFGGVTFDPVTELPKNSGRKQESFKYNRQNPVVPRTTFTYLTGICLFLFPCKWLYHQFCLHLKNK